MQWMKRHQDKGASPHLTHTCTQWVNQDENHINSMHCIYTTDMHATKINCMWRNIIWGSRSMCGNGTIYTLVLYKCRIITSYSKWKVCITNSCIIGCVWMPFQNVPYYSWFSDMTYTARTLHSSIIVYLHSHALICHLNVTKWVAQYDSTWWSARIRAKTRNRLR